MGHERIGFLPKTKQWKTIVDQLADYGTGSDTVAQIADTTLTCIRTLYEKLPYEESLIKSVRFLVLLSTSANQQNQQRYLLQNGISVDTQLSLFSILGSANKYIETATDSLECTKIAKDSILQTVTAYQRTHAQNQISLFGSDDSESVWANVGTGAAFCELARSFVATFTDRQLKYFIERSAASAINDYSRLQMFSAGITEQAEAISHHAFETSKIMQSFAAGWFNNHTASGLPSDDEIVRFLRMSFGKMREEFRREAEGL